MSSKKTEHLQLHEWEGKDLFKLSEFNDNFRRIDSGVKKTDSKIGDLRKLATSVNGDLVSAVNEVANNVDEVLDDGIEASILRTKIDEKLIELETQYAPRLAETVKREDIGVISIDEFPLQVPETDDTERIKRMLASVTGKINKIIFPKNIYNVSGSSINVNLSDVIFEGNSSTIKKTSGSGYVFDFGGNLTQKNIYLKNFIFEGDNTALANGGLAFATNKDTSQIRGLRLENIICRRFAQYGVNIGSVSDINVSNIRIEEHGSIASGATIGIGFVIYPKNAQSKCIINGLYSEISVESKLNASAAFKYQVISDGIINNVHVIGGREAVISIEATNNTVYSNFIIDNKHTTGTLGLVVSSNNNSYGITNASFQMNNFRFLGNYTTAFTLSAYNVSDCDFSNFNFRKVTAGKRVAISTNGVVDNCSFTNFYDVGMRMNVFSGAVCINSKFNNIETTGSSFTLTGDNNEIKNLKNVNSGVIQIIGNGNSVYSSESVNSSSHAFQINGNNNRLYNPISINPTSRPVWIQGGDGNKIVNLRYEGALAVLNNGTNTVEVGTTVVA